MTQSRDRAARWQAAVFDFDGVLVDSAEVYRLALSEAVAFVPREEWPRLYGMTTLEAVVFASGGTMPEARAEQVSIDIDRRVGELLASTPPAREGAQAVLQALRSRGIPLAVASSASRLAIDGTISALGWSDYFVAVVGREDVVHSKPHPDAYREAVARLRVSPSVTFAVEDTDIGVRSARGAGLFTIALGGTQSRSELAVADLYFDDFDGMVASDWYHREVLEDCTS